MKHNLLKLLFCLILSTVVCLHLKADSTLDYTLKRAGQLQQKREYAESAKLLDRYIDNYFVNPTREDSLKMVDILRMQGDNFYYLGVSSRAAELYEHALKIAQAAGLKRRMAELSNELFIVYFNSGNLTFSHDLLKNALELYKSLNDTIGQCKILNNLGILFYTEEKVSQSLQYYEDAVRLAGNDSSLKAGIYTNIAESYSRLGELRKADEYLDMAINFAGRRYDSSDVLQSWLNKAQVQAALGNKEYARSILRNVSANVNTGEADRLVELYTRISKIYLEAGDSINGLRWNLKSAELSDSLNTRLEHDQLREMIVRYNAERIEGHNKMLELDVKRHTQINYILAALIFVVVIFSVMLFVRLRSDRRKNRLIHSQREQLLEFERIEHDRKEHEFKEELDRKNRELTAYSIDAASISELHKILIDSLKKIRAAGTSEAREEINETISRLQNFNRKEVKEDFRVYFNEVHPDYLNRLSERFPVLTPNDLRLCSYLYLGMSTKEIAALTFREIRSVESSRLRLRKKLGLQPDTTLHDFLHTL